MQKINFEDKPSTTTPIDADNLNLLQDNVEEAINEVQSNLDTANTYSLEETHIGTWLGKPLYRKVINFGSLPNNGQKNVNHNISNLDLIINLYGFGKRPTDGTIIPLQFVKPDDANGEVGMFANNTEIFVIDAFDRSNITETYIVVEYTKTTDEVSEVSA